jgi:hypothetical protein
MAAEAATFQIVVKICMAAEQAAVVREYCYSFYYEPVCCATKFYVLCKYLSIILQ